MATKEETAQFLVDAHFRLDQGITRIFRIVEPDEAGSLRPLKLLEISPATVEVGISPLGFPADPARGVFFKTVIVEVTPAEFARLNRGELSLPNGWSVGPELFPVTAPTRVAS